MTWPLSSPPAGIRSHVLLVLCPVALESLHFCPSSLLPPYPPDFVSYLDSRSSTLATPSPYLALLVFSPLSTQSHLFKTPLHSPLYTCQWCPTDLCRKTRPLWVPSKPLSLVLPLLALCFSATLATSPSSSNIPCSLLPQDPDTCSHLFPDHFLPYLCLPG